MQRNGRTSQAFLSVEGLEDEIRSRGFSRPMERLPLLSCSKDIRTDKITVYSACKKFVDTMRKDGLKPSVVYVHRSRLPELFQSVLGEENFSKTVFNRLVPKGDSYVTTRKAIPTFFDFSSKGAPKIPAYRSRFFETASKPPGLPNNI